MAQSAKAHPIPALSDVPQTHGELMVQLKSLEHTLGTLRQAQNKLIEIVRQQLAIPVMVLMARQNIGGRVYLRWRWRYGQRSYFDLADHLHQIEVNWHDALLHIEQQRLTLNYAYSTRYHDHRRLLELKAQRKRLNDVRQSLKNDLLTVTTNKGDKHV